MIEIGKYLYHMTHINHLGGMMQHGILSHTLAHDLNMTLVDISDPAVQERRHDRIETVYKRHIHDYAPFYLNPKNPMLYVRRHLQQELVIVCVAPVIIKDHQYVYADGNAASGSTTFGTNDHIFDSCTDVLLAGSWNCFQDGKRKRCAEVLVYPKAEPKYIQRVVCFNQGIVNRAAQLTGVETCVDSAFFF